MTSLLNGNFYIARMALVVTNNYVFMCMCVFISIGFKPEIKIYVFIYALLIRK